MRQKIPQPTQCEVRPESHWLSLITGIDLTEKKQGDSEEKKQAFHLEKLRRK